MGSSDSNIYTVSPFVIYQVIMKGAIVFLGVLSASLSLHIPSNDRPDYVTTDDGKLTSGADQYIYCYDQPNCYGTRITIGTSPVPDLAYSPYYFDNRIQSCNYNGIYILYDGRNFNQDNLNGAVYAEAWGENNCVNMDGFSNKATSIRLSGAPNGWMYDTINFYEGQLYNGREQYFYGDATSFQYDNFGQSMIITGCSPWTLYEYTNFGGQSACWYPADTQNCYPAFFRDPAKMNGWANQVSSVRHGCFSKTKYYGEPLPFEESTNKAVIGNSGHFLQN